MIAPDRWITVAESQARPEVTVVMPVFRQERYVAEAVRSVLAQDGPPCEVLISDDAGGDATLELAMAAVAAEEGAHAHTVRVRRRTERLGRAHLHELATHASCSILVQAHGDDVSAPWRVRRVLAAFEVADAAVVTSGFDAIGGRGGLISSWQGDDRVRRIRLETVLERPEWSIGAVIAWAPERLAVFPHLDLAYAPMSHDRLMCARAAMLGRLWLVDAPLVARRSHGDAWSRRLVDTGSAQSRDHGWALTIAMWASAMRDDLDHLRAIAPDLVDGIEVAGIDAVRDEALRRLRGAHGELLREGRALRWEQQD